MFSQIRKRDGTIVKFKASKVAAALEKTMLAVGIDDDNLPKLLAEQVINQALKIHSVDYVISVEEMQDIAEKTLINEGHADKAIKVDHHKDLLFLFELFLARDLIHLSYL